MTTPPTPPQSNQDTKTHPLHSSWSLYFNIQSKKKKGDWDKKMEKVYTVDTVEKFWSLVTHIPKPSELQNQTSYYLFRDHIKPAWEDDQNRSGGVWGIQFKDRSKIYLDNYWENLMLATIGEMFTDSEVVNGVIVALRKNGSRLQLWTREHEDLEKMTQLGKEIMRFISEKYPFDKSQLEFITWSDAWGDPARIIVDSRLKVSHPASQGKRKK